MGALSQCVKSAQLDAAIGRLKLQDKNSGHILKTAIQGRSTVKNLPVYLKVLDKEEDFEYVLCFNNLEESGPWEGRLVWVPEDVEEDDFPATESLEFRGDRFFLGDDEQDHYELSKQCLGREWRISYDLQSLNNE